MTRCTNPQPQKIDRDLLNQTADALLVLHRFTRHVEDMAESVCSLLEHDEKHTALRLAKSLADLAEQATNHDADILSALICEAIPAQKGGVA